MSELRYKCKRRFKISKEKGLSSNSLYFSYKHEPYSDKEPRDKTRLLEKETGILLCFIEFIFGTERSFIRTEITWKIKVYLQIVILEMYLVSNIQVHFRMTIKLTLM